MCHEDINQSEVAQDMVHEVVMGVVVVVVVVLVMVIVVVVVMVISLFVFKRSMVKGEEEEEDT